MQNKSKISRLIVMVSCIFFKFMIIREKHIPHVFSCQNHILTYQMGTPRSRFPVPYRFLIVINRGTRFKPLNFIYIFVTWIFIQLLYCISFCYWILLLDFWCCSWLDFVIWIFYNWIWMTWIFAIGLTKDNHWIFVRQILWVSACAF